MTNNPEYLNTESIINLSELYRELGVLGYEEKEYGIALGYLEDAFSHLKEQYGRVNEDFDADGEIRKSLSAEILDVREKIIKVANKLGDFKQQNKDYHGAIDCYRKTFYYAGNDAETFYKLGKCSQFVGSVISALLFYEKALAAGFEPDDIYRYMGDIYASKEDFENAILCYKKYIEKRPNEAHSYGRIGHFYDRISHYENIDLQIEFFEKALALDPNDKLTLRNLVIEYPRVDKYKEAQECYQRLFKLGASMDDYFNYSCFRIRLRDFEEGWKLYEKRFLKEMNPTPYPKIKKSLWKGQNIGDKTLLVQWEQGFGDTIHFSRYLPQLKNLAGKIIFRVQDSMCDLMKLNADGYEVVPSSIPVEKIAFNYHVPLMSLPYVLKGTIDNIPLSEGYIKADKKLSNKYKKEFFNNDCLKIGISWQGADIGNKLRNIPIETFYPLTKLKNVKVYSFQKGPCAEVLAQLPEGIEIVDVGKTFSNFNDTAAAMDNIDLFISSDNAVPHVAGAMAKPTYFMINKNNEWRWFLDTKTTPWYKSFKLFKKKDENDSWDLLMAEVIADLQKNKLVD